MWSFPGMARVVFLVVGSSVQVLSLSRMTVQSHHIIADHITSLQPCQVQFPEVTGPPIAPSPGCADTIAVIKERISPALPMAKLERVTGPLVAPGPGRTCTLSVINDRF